MKHIIAGRTQPLDLVRELGQSEQRSRRGRICPSRPAFALALVHKRQRLGTSPRHFWGRMGFHSTASPVEGSRMCLGKITAARKSCFGTPHRRLTKRNGRWRLQKNPRTKQKPREPANNLPTLSRISRKIPSHVLILPFKKRIFAQCEEGNRRDRYHLFFFFFPTLT